MTHSVISSPGHGLPHGFRRALLCLAWAIAVAVCSFGALAAVGAQPRKLPQDYEKKRQAIANFEVGVVPLFVLGDVNEDGVVDQEDLRLLRAYVASRDESRISCPAAADLDDNGSINEKDISVLEQILSKGPVQAPALSAHSRLGCNFKRFFIAARPGARPGGTVPIHFLDPAFSVQNSKVTLVAGRAEVTTGKNEFIVQIEKDAPAGSIITVAITVPNNRKYFYSFRVAPAP